ncbi:M48 family metalloprotease [Microtetraspora sp. AC03309]|uniref:M48 family metallopeptidase n=1 Tax=Microtetraspora sp. AC03309 TaxID=2779376 RepID=UPI001E418A46|nr:M48 family metallopeptidase [Microtetraspora sp. AC03309]MCC5580560.1 M48 family metalloprotease [Microtetraspora sp. AC03309]
MTPSAIVQECPQCSASISADPRFVVWCRDCEWNIRPDNGERQRPQGMLDRFRSRLARRYVADLHRRVLDSGPGLPSRDPARIASYALATIVHLFAVSLTLAGVWLLASTWPSPFGIALGIAVLAFAYLVRPRLGRVRKDALTLTRQEAPTLYDLLDRVAGEIGAPPVDIVVVDGDLNACFATVGLRRRHMLTIGLPLWLILDRAERVALLGHELAHSTNGDSRHGLYVGSALNTLYELRQVLAPIVLDGGLIEIAATFLLNVVMWLIRVPVTGTIMLLELMTYRSSQLAEYAADERAAQVASPVAAAGLMDKCITRFSAAGRHVVSSAHRTGDLWEGLREYMDGFPELEEERLRRLAPLEAVRVDAFHPPTHLRMAFAVALPYGAAEVTVTEGEMERIQGELDTAGDRIAREITDQARAALYQ